MIRKLVKQGAATMMISLPTKWIKENKLDKGDEISLEERGNRIIIEKGQKNEVNEVNIEITDRNIDDIKILLTHTYRKGADRIVLTGKISGISPEVNRICSNILMGFEIVERSKSKIVLENISQPDETKYSSILSKVFMIVEEMPNFIYKENQDIEEAKNTKDQCDKFVLFCRRILSENKSDLDPVLEWEFLTLLTHIQHNYYYMIEYIIKNKINLSKETENLILESKNYFGLVEKAYTKKDYLSIDEVNSLKNKYQFGKCIDLINNAKGKEATVASYIREIFRLMQISTSPILSEILEKKN